MGATRGKRIGLARCILLSIFALSSAPSLAQTVDIERGGDLFREHCTRCHIPVEMEQRLRNDWYGHSAAELLERISTTMPGENPGSLTPEEYRDVTAYAMLVGKVDVADATITPVQTQTTQQAEVPWTYFNGDVKAQRYAALDQINADNVGDLEIAWRWNSTSFGPSPEGLGVVSPLMVNGIVYTTAGLTRNIVALDAATGQTLWMWRPQEGDRFVDAPRKGAGKGLAFWSDGTQDIIFTVTPGYYLVALNARTGLPVESFAAGGWLDLKEGLRLASSRDDIDITLTFPPLVVGDVVVVGAAHALSVRPPHAENVKGDIRAFNIKTGEKLWTFHTIPAKGEEGYDTWLNGSADYTGNAGVWAPMSADPELGLVYLPIETATGDYYGGDRPGSNLYASSLVALDYTTGEKKWHYQLVHHDIWDWDTPSAPILADLPNGRKVVVQLTKQAMAYVFDRETGEPIWDIIETPVPQTDVPGEWTSPTQPIPSRPAPYDRQGITRDDLIAFTPTLKALARVAAQPFRLGSFFTPPSLANDLDGTKGTLQVPHPTGGTNWEGGGYDPETGILYVPSQTAVGLMSLVPGGEDSTVAYIQGNTPGPNVDGLPIISPPWGRITAIDLMSGDHLWWVANADTPDAVRDHPALEGVDLPRTGIAARAPILLTKSLLLAGEGANGKALLRAHDKATGETVGEVATPLPVTGIPITYLHDGKQYIVMAVSGEGRWELVALALPEQN